MSDAPATTETDLTSETPIHDAWRRRESRQAIARATMRAVAWVVGVLILYYVLPIDPHSDASAIARIILGAAVLVAVVVWQIIAVVRSDHARARAIDALASCTVVVIAVFASVYINMAARDPQAFTEPLTRTSALYFTIVTLATIGYGDIAPRTDTARVVLMLQVLVNIVILGSAVKLIAELARRGGHPRERDHGT